MKAPTLVCTDGRRREAVRKRDLNGLDYVEVSDDGLTLTLYFLGKAPRDVEPGNILIEGGRRISGIRAVGVTPHYQDDPDLDDWLVVEVDRAGDFSTYTILMVERDRHGRPTHRPLGGFDPRYSRAEFSFKAGCVSDLDCGVATACSTAEPHEPPIDYLAKDYASFRRLILDRLSVLMPEWRERHVPDLGIALVEVLAYAGDHLSYYQDAAATEAYLDPARERISVRRHARLVDYRMHEGCNARAFVCIGVETDFPVTLGKYFFVTGYDTAPDGEEPMSDEDLAGVPPSSYEVFEPLLGADAPPVILRRGHSLIRFYAWGDRECCLSRGATSATLLDEWEGPPQADKKERPLNLNSGDFLLLEEVKGPRTGSPADADRSHRHSVRLTSVHADVDPLTGTHVVEVEWSPEDALPFALCISSTSQAPACEPLDDVSIACGNVIPVDHGRTVSPPEDLGTVPGDSLLATCEPCDETGGAFVVGRYRPELTRLPLTYSEALQARTSAARLLRREPRQAAPGIGLTNIPPAPDRSGPLLLSAEWRDPALLVASVVRSAGQPVARASVEAVSRDDGAACPNRRRSAAGPRRRAATRVDTVRRDLDAPVRSSLEPARRPAFRGRDRQRRSRPPSLRGRGPGPESGGRRRLHSDLPNRQRPRRQCRGRDDLASRARG